MKARQPFISSRPGRPHSSHRRRSLATVYDVPPEGGRPNSRSAHAGQMNHRPLLRRRSCSFTKRTFSSSVEPGGASIASYQPFIRPCPTLPHSSHTKRHGMVIESHGWKPGPQLDLLAQPAHQRLARPLEPAPVDELGERARGRFRSPARQAGETREHGLGFLEANIGARLWTRSSTSSSASGRLTKSSSAAAARAIVALPVSSARRKRT